MTKDDIEKFIKDVRTSFLKDFAIPGDAESSILPSAKSHQSKIDRSDIPVPELVRFTLGIILQLPVYGPGEKLRWEMPFLFKNIRCAFALEKFGLRLYVRSPGTQLVDGDKISEEIIGKLRKAIHRTERVLLIPFANEQIENSQFTIVNRYHSLMNRFIYFRDKAGKTSKNRDKVKGKGKIGELAKLLNYMVRLENELFYNTLAMLDAYFSFLEHLFVLVAPLSSDRIKLVEFISCVWADKFKQLFDLKLHPKAKSFYDKLNDIKERYRNVYAHGGFEKGGASLYVHFPGIGAIPAQFSKIKNSPHFNFFPIQEESFRDICRLLDDFDEWLRSEASGLAKAIKYVESGLDIPCDRQSIAEIRAAMKSEGALKALIERESYLWAMHTNMDY
jgi:hypothetical protein